jgi:hypothetical protein
MRAAAPGVNPHISIMIVSVSPHTGIDKEYRGIENWEITAKALYPFVRASLSDLS